MKRGPDDRPVGQQQQYKKQKHSNDSRYGRDRPDYRRDDNRSRNGPPDRRDAGSRNHENIYPQQKKLDGGHEEALSKLPPSTSQSASVPAYVPFTTGKGLPALPDIKPGPLRSAPFKHKSLTTYDRASGSADITYERLEFLGDAYIELIASRLIFERYPTLTAGRQSQVRELLVKNETLAEYSRAYGFEERIEIGAKEKMMEDVSRKVAGNKGFNKVLGDVFEAYVAAVILSDVEDGFAVAEKWLTALWAPKLLENEPHANGTPTSATNDDSLNTYNPTGKADLQKRIPGSKDVKLEYDRYADSIELKGAQLGQNKHFIAVYLTGFGYERKELGRGEGRNKVEAGNWAAQRAMFGEFRRIVEECEKKAMELREKRAREREAAAAADGAVADGGG